MLRQRRFLAWVLMSLPLARATAQHAIAPGGGGAATASVAAFRKGLELSTDGNSWGRSRTVTLPPTRCPPASASPCARGTAPLIVNIRFPAIASAADGDKVLAQLGESGAKNVRYFVRPVPANATGTVCGDGFAVSTPLRTMRVAINLGASGAPLPVTCRWTALAGVPDPGAPAGLQMVWSDTVMVQVTGKP